MLSDEAQSKAKQCAVNTCMPCDVPATSCCLHRLLVGIKLVVSRWPPGDCSCKTSLMCLSCVYRHARYIVTICKDVDTSEMRLILIQAVNWRQAHKDRRSKQLPYISNTTVANVELSPKPQQTGKVHRKTCQTTHSNYSCDVHSPGGCNCIDITKNALVCDHTMQAWGLCMH
jgi:hypothetical protein